MKNYRERLEVARMLAAFERARRAQDMTAMQRILVAAKFTPPEIESILWSKGDMGDAPTTEDKRKQLWDEIIGRVGIAILSGAILGGVFVYVSSGLDSTERSGAKKMDKLMSDYRSPREAYYRPFLWGFAIGGVGALITGALVYDPTSKKH